MISGLRISVRFSLMSASFSDASAAAIVVRWLFQSQPEKKERRKEEKALKSLWCWVECVAMRYRCDALRCDFNPIRMGGAIISAWIGLFSGLSMPVALGAAEGRYKAYVGTL